LACCAIPLALIWVGYICYYFKLFTIQGRLYQVEYAMEAISHAGTAIGILSKGNFYYFTTVVFYLFFCCSKLFESHSLPIEGVVLAAEKKVPSKLLEPSHSSEKMYVLDQHAACAVAGTVLLLIQHLIFFFSALTADSFFPQG
jgi:hypothetical protein